jgi:hypothetical protein
MIKQIRHWLEERRFRRTFVATEDSLDKNTTSNWQEVNVNTPEGNKFLYEQLIELKEARKKMMKDSLYLDAMGITVIIWSKQYLLFRHSVKAIHHESEILGFSIFIYSMTLGITFS